MDPFQKIDDGRTDGQSVGRIADGLNRLMLANSMVTLAVLAEKERETETRTAARCFQRVSPQIQSYS